MSQAWLDGLPVGRRVDFGTVGPVGPYDPHDPNIRSVTILVDHAQPLEEGAQIPRERSCLGSGRG